MSDPTASYHARVEDSGEVIILVRLREVGEATYGERYRRNEGWIRDDYAFDVLLNGQDYEVLTDDEVLDAIAQIDARPEDDG
ncbi:hypothetical protein ABT256_33090 [Amycolatopsis japonica]|uniref:hypothetical protein n=1 Tax=Amycolatopsis japonica TaxID=208439 RepID=UPI00332177DA